MQDNRESKTTPQEKNLEEELEFLSKKILELNKRFMESQEAKSRFLSLVKNQLNNPMTVLLGMIKHLDIVKNEKNIEIFSMIHQELLTLDFEIQNIVMAAQIEGDSIAISYALIEPVLTLEDAVESIKYILQERAQTLKIENLLPKKIVTDREMLFIIIRNILLNACKYGESGSEISIKLSIVEERFVLEVKNRGEAPHVKHKAELFTRFADGPDGRHGLGIGLSVVREICELLDGDIDYEVQDEYIIFRVSLLLDENSELAFEPFDDAIEF